MSNSFDVDNISSYSPVDVLNFAISFSFLEERSGSFQETEYKDVTFIIANSQQRFWTACYSRCHVCQWSRNIFHAIQTEALDERSHNGGKKVQTSSCEIQITFFSKSLQQARNSFTHRLMPPLANWIRPCERSQWSSRSNSLSFNFQTTNMVRNGRKTLYNLFVFSAKEKCFFKKK